VDVDVAIAMDHLILAAAEEGLGTCWICAFDPAIARKALGLPAGIEPIAFTPVGYAEDEPVPKARKKLEEIVRYEKW
jgi:nitroreductase